MTSFFMRMFSNKKEDKKAAPPVAAPPASKIEFTAKPAEIKKPAATAAGSPATAKLTPGPPLAIDPTSAYQPPPLFMGMSVKLPPTKPASMTAAGAAPSPAASVAFSPPKSESESDYSPPPIPSAGVAQSAISPSEYTPPIPDFGPIPASNKSTSPAAAVTAAEPESAPESEYMPPLALIQPQTAPAFSVFGFEKPKTTTGFSFMIKQPPEVVPAPLTPQTSNVFFWFCYCVLRIDTNLCIRPKLCT